MKNVLDCLISRLDTAGKESALEDMSVQTSKSEKHRGEKNKCGIATRSLTQM